MTLTREQIKDYIYSLTIRNYVKDNIYGLMKDYYGFKNICKIEIFRYDESFDIHIRYGGKDIFWVERCEMLDIVNIKNRRYKFRQQIDKNLPKYVKQKAEEVDIDIQAILAKYKV